MFQVAGDEHSAPLLPFLLAVNVAQDVLYPSQFVARTDVQDLQFSAVVVVDTLLYPAVTVVGTLYHSAVRVVETLLHPASGRTFPKPVVAAGSSLYPPDFYSPVTDFPILEIFRHNVFLESSFVPQPPAISPPTILGHASLLLQIFVILSTAL